MDKKANKKNKNIHEKIINILTILLVILVFAFIVILYIIVQPHMLDFINYISLTTNDYVKSNIFMAFVYSTVIQIIFNVFFCPGLTFFNIAIGYFVPSLFLSFSLVYVASMISTLPVYFVSKYLYRVSLDKLFKKKWFYSILQKESKEKPWKTSWVIRVIFIPTAYKNYIIPLFDITFVQFAVPSIIFNIFYLGLMVLVGYNTKNFKKVFSRNSEKTLPSKILSYFFYILMIVLFLLIIYVIWFTIKKYKQYNTKKDNKEDLKEIDSKKSKDNKLDCPLYN